MTYNPTIILESFESPLIYLIYGKKKEHLPRTNLKIILKIALSIQHLLYRNHVFTACYPVEGNTWHEGKYDGLLKKKSLSSKVIVKRVGEYLSIIHK